MWSKVEQIKVQCYIPTGLRQQVFSNYRPTRSGIISSGKDPSRPHQSLSTFPESTTRSALPFHAQLFAVHL